jgi:hypothetical protein
MSGVAARTTYIVILKEGACGSWLGIFLSLPAVPELLQVFSLRVRPSAPLSLPASLYQFPVVHPRARVVTPCLLQFLLSFRSLAGPWESEVSPDKASLLGVLSPAQAVQDPALLPPTPGFLPSP